MHTRAVGIIVGRFQVPDLHSGHKSLFTKAGEKLSELTEQYSLIVGIGVSPLIGDKDNPLSYEMRHNVINYYLRNSSDFSEDNYQIIPILDVGNDGEWYAGVENLVKTMHPNTKIYFIGSRDSWIEKYKGSVEVLKIESDDDCSGTDVRKYIATSAPLNSELFYQGVIYGVMNRYDRVNATVDIVPIVDDTHIILGQKPGETTWRFPGGFSDPSDSSFAHSASRELLEEMDIYFPSFSLKYINSFRIHDWRYAHSSDSIISTFFAAKLTSPVEFKAGDDLAQAKMFTIKEFLDPSFPINPCHKILQCELAAYLRKD